jgi:hypothetical protein
VLFGIAVTLALALKLFVVIYPLMFRALPPEVDDSLAYILSAAVLAECPQQDCPALVEIRNQTMPGTATSEQSASKWDLYSRAFLIHSPLSAGVMIGLHALSFGWLEAFNLWTVATVFVVVGGFAYWLRGLVGPGPAAAALLLVALTRFSGHGLVWFVPAVMCVGVAAWTWGYSLRRRPGRLGVLLLACAVMMSLHQIGKVWAVASVAMWFLSCPSPWTRRTVAGAAAAFGFIGAWAGATMLVTAPMLTTPAVDPQLVPDLLGRVSWNLPRAWEVVADLFAPHYYHRVKFPAVFVLLLIAGLIWMPRQTRRDVLMAALVLGGVSMLSLVHFHPTVPATLFDRIFVPLAAVGAAATGFGIHQGVVRGMRLIAAGGGTRWRRGATAAAVLGMAVLAGRGLYSYAWLGTNNLHGAAVQKIWRQNNEYSAATAARLVGADSCDRIGYSDFKVMFFALINNALRCPAVYLPIVSPDELAAMVVAEQQPLRHLLLTGPLGDNRGRLIASAEQPLEIIASVAPPLLQLRFDFQAQGRTIEIRQGKRIRTLTLPDGDSWVEVSKADRDLPLSVAPADGKGPLYVTGMRVDAADRMNWPWNRGIRTRSLVTPFKPFPYAPWVSEVTFALDLKVPGGRLTIEDDSGTMVLVQIEPER